MPAVGIAEQGGWPQSHSDINPMADNSSTQDFSECVEVSFHGVAYLLKLSTVNEDTMCLEVEQKSDASRWRGDFTSRYIEDITSKTGNFKRFPVFVRMLSSALKQASDSVFVDLLTYQDLEALKSRKAGGAAQPSKSLVPNNKRYLILTYAAEFDRVHYPLPLLYEENPDPHHLKGIIASLRAQLDAVQGSQGGGRRQGAQVHDQALELRRVREENEALRQELRQGERSGRGDQQAGDRGGSEARQLAREVKELRKERELLSARLDGFEAELERERGLHRRELRRKAKENQEAYEELARSRDQVRQLRLQVRQLTDELDGLRAQRGSASDRLRAVYGGRPHDLPSSARSSRPYSGGSARRTGSRGSSPSGRDLPPHSSSYTSSRGGPPGSRGPDTSTRERGGGGGSGSRPSSAPASGRSGSRFDPTEYVRQRKEAMERRSSANSSRAPTPPRSQASSGRASPMGSRPASAERGGGRAGYSPSGSRSGSLDGYRQVAGGQGYGAAPGRPAPVQATARSRAASPSGQPAGGSAWSKFPPLSTAGGAGGGGLPGRGSGSRPQSAERSTSPGRALQEVKKKLSEYVNKRSSDDVSTSSLPRHSDLGLAPDAPSLPASSLPSQSSKNQLFNDASAEIADIDSRLHALQNFLRMAKASAPSSDATPSQGGRQ